MSGKLYQIKRLKLINEIKIEFSNDENFEIKLLDDFKCTLTCIRILSLNNQNHYETSSKDFKDSIIISTSKGSIEILYNSNHTYKRLENFIAHKPQPDNKDIRFGSLKYKAEIWSLTIKEKYINFNEYKYILNIISASEDQTIKIWELNLFDYLECENLYDNIGIIGDKLNVFEKSKEKKIVYEAIKTYKNHELAVTSVDCKNIYLMGEKKKVLVTCSDDKIINIYNAEDDEFTFIRKLTTKDKVFGWHTITYLCLEEVFSI